MSSRFKQLSGVIPSSRSDLSFRGRCESIWRVRRFALSFALAGSNNPWLKGFIREVWRYRTMRRREIVLHYAPELAQDIIPEMHLLQWKDELRALERRFGFRLPRVDVFLFPAVGCVSDLFGPRYAALALPSFNAIVIGDRANGEEVVRHELVHLFAWRWNCHAPPLLSEGLAVHLQQRCYGYPINAWIRRFGGRSEWTLKSLVDQSFFFDSTYRHACYLIAGSFSGFLIDEFGWDAYRRLYQSCRAHLVEWAFCRSLGISFQEAESRWRKRC